MFHEVRVRCDAVSSRMGSSLPQLYSSTVKVDEEAFSEMSGIAYQNTLCRNQEIATHSDINSRRIKWTQLVASVGRKNCMCNMLAVKTEGKRPFESPERRWEVNIKISLKRIII